MLEDVNGRKAMSVTSTRRVSSATSYTSPARGGYETAGRGQSFVENIDTTNNVLISDEDQSQREPPRRQHASDDEDFQVEAKDNQALNESGEMVFKPTQSMSPLLDNDEIPSPMVQNQSIGIYGANQDISYREQKSADNPYLKHFYENNEEIEDIDELV